jgi:hypothetical protein
MSPRLSNGSEIRLWSTAPVGMEQETTATPEVTMPTHPDVGGVPPDDNMTGSSTDDGVPVGAADAEADARRSGASDADERPSNVGEGFLLDVDPGRGTDDGVPVGHADAEADRIRSVDDDDRV